VRWAMAKYPLAEAYGWTCVHDAAGGADSYHLPYQLLYVISSKRYTHMSIAPTFGRCLIAACNAKSPHACLFTLSQRIGPTLAAATDAT